MKLEKLKKFKAKHESRDQRKTKSRFHQLFLTHTMLTPYFLSKRSEIQKKTEHNAIK
jgi:CRISPR/Cas system CSM-associated protein Csm4 (group 5 of RAMP superfamily)